jgi:hypothetical protein
LEQKAHNEASLQRKVDRQEEADRGQMVKAAAQAEWLTKLRATSKSQLNKLIKEAKGISKQKGSAPQPDSHSQAC